MFRSNEQFPNKGVHGGAVRAGWLWGLLVTQVHPEESIGVLLSETLLSWYTMVGLGHAPTWRWWDKWWRGVSLAAGAPGTIACTGRVGTC